MVGLGGACGGGASVPRRGSRAIDLAAERFIPAFLCVALPLMGRAALTGSVAAELAGEAGEDPDECPCPEKTAKPVGPARRLLPRPHG